MEAPAMRVSIAGVAELYAAACAFEPADPKALEGMGDMARVSCMTTAGSVRRLCEALEKLRAVT